MTPKKSAIRRCVLYSRISVATEESVSIERQIEAGRKYADARGWEVVGVYRDEGISATHNRPEDREGWKALLDSPKDYQAVVIWKVDRLARRVLDFLNANEALNDRGASLVCVEDPIDMTSDTGVAFATMLAVFGQLEAATIRTRVLGAQNHLLKQGRYVGGLLPYGYLAVRNPDGPGFVIAQDPEVIEVVREIVRRTQAGHTLYSTKQWLNESKSPTASMLAAARIKDGDLTTTGKPRKAPKVTEVWSYNTIDRLVRHPLLAGMVPHNRTGITRDPAKINAAKRDGAKPLSRATMAKRRGDDVVRDDDGLPIIREDLAVMPVEQWRAMQRRLDAVDKPQKQPKSMQRTHSGLLSGLLWCADPRHPEPVRMYRGTHGKKDKPQQQYVCRTDGCFQSITNAQDLIVRHILDECADEVLFRPTVEEVEEGGAVQLAEASVRLNELFAQLANPDLDASREEQIMAEVARLKVIQREAKARPPIRRRVDDGTDPALPVREAYEAAEDDVARRRILDFVLNRILLTRGPMGAWSDAAKLARMEFVWGPFGPRSLPSDEHAARWADEDPAVKD